MSLDNKIDVFIPIDNDRSTELERYRLELRCDCMIILSRLEDALNSRLANYQSLINIPGIVFSALAGRFDREGRLKGRGRPASLDEVTVVIPTPSLPIPSLVVDAGVLRRLLAFANRDRGFQSRVIKYDAFMSRIC
jgi:hypothetical protein